MWKHHAAPPFFREAEQDALDSVAEPNEAVNRLSELAAEVHALAAHVRPEYEYTSPIAFGGLPAGSPFACPVPFSGPCEVAVVMVTALGNETGNVLLTTEQNASAQFVSVTGTATLAPTPFALIISTLNSTVAPPITWYPLSGNTSIYFALSSNYTKSVFAMVQFRRRINPAGVPQFGYP